MVPAIHGGIAGRCFVSRVPKRRVAEPLMKPTRREWSWTESGPVESIALAYLTRTSFMRRPETFQS